MHQSGVRRKNPKWHFNFLLQECVGHSHERKTILGQRKPIFCGGAFEHKKMKAMSTASLNIVVVSAVVFVGCQSYYLAAFQV